MLPSLVTAVIYEPFDLDWCLGDENCIKSERNPWGIPLWKVSLPLRIDTALLTDYHAI